MERSMIGVKIKDRYSSHSIRNQTRVIDILSKIDIQKWRWAGHSQRDDRKNGAKSSQTGTHEMEREIEADNIGGGKTTLNRPLDLTGAE
ncbi:jg26670 [Pararge aegeria aegeria]|uniref:Jg26670 protein n=1 Tax=Pararge aegeria aegeria TaxID=348720 RepID=A0A8S4RUQ7_9NEOP|nr:jg26670 [Pararge aegeria aegeria]